MTAMKVDVVVDGGGGDGSCGRETNSSWTHRGCAPDVQPTTLCDTKKITIVESGPRILPGMVNHVVDVATGLSIVASIYWLLSTVICWALEMDTHDNEVERECGAVEHGGAGIGLGS